MKRILIIAVTMSYTLGAVATYNADRELGRAHCWKSEQNNQAWSSLVEAAMWPIAAVLFGMVIVTTNNAAPWQCLAEK